jgi:hypothetical protein
LRPAGVSDGLVLEFTPTSVDTLEFASASVDALAFTAASADALTFAAATVAAGTVGGELTTSGTPTFNGDSSVTIDAVTDILSAPASLLDETQSWVAFRIRPNWASTGDPMGGGVGVFFFDWADNSTDRIIAGYTPSTDKWFLQRSATGGASSQTLAEGTTESFAAGDSRTVIFAWDATRLRISGQGRAFTNSASAVDIPTLTASEFYIGTSQQSSRHLAGDILWFACGTGTLTDADAVALHGFGGTDPGFAALPGSPTLLWTADNTEWLEGPLSLFAAVSADSLSFTPH